MSKSHVGMGYHVCPICGTKHDEVVLIDKRLQDTLERDNFVGWKMCVPHETMYEQGYIALVEAKPSDLPSGNTLSGADRTGRILHIAKQAWRAVLNCPLPETPLAFIDPAAFDMIAEKYALVDGSTPTPPTVH